MSRLLGFVVVAVLAGGCGDDTTNSAMSDLATVTDMSVAADLTALGCDGILTCQQGCGQNLVCQNDCRQSGTATAKNLFDAFSACLVLTCAPVDGGTKSCTSPTDNSAPCRTCLASTATQAMAPGGPCYAEYSACAAN